MPLFTEGFETSFGNFTPAGAYARSTSFAHTGTESVWDSATGSTTILYSNKANSYAAGTDGNTSAVWYILLNPSSAGGYIYLLSRLRGVGAAAPTYAASGGYAIRFINAGVFSPVITKLINGTDSPLAAMMAAGSILTSQWYRVQLDCSGTTITGYVQRPNGDYLTAANTWTTSGSPLPFMTITGETSLAAAGDSAMGSLLYQPSGVGAFLDDVSLTSLAAGGTAWTQTLTETLSFTDTRIAGAAHNLTESLLFSDTRIMSVAKSLAETLVLSDLRTASVGKTAQETLAFVDALTRAASYQRTLSETLVLSDVRAAGLARKLSETYGLSDSVAAGIVTAATLIIVSIGPGGSA